MRVARDGESASDVEQLRRLERVAEMRLVDDLADVADAAEAEVRLHLEELSRLRGMQLETDDITVVRLRLEPLCEDATLLRLAELRQACNDLVVFENG